MDRHDHPDINPIRYERLARAARVDVRIFPREPLSPLAAPRTYYSDPGPLRISAPGAAVDAAEMETIAEAGWRVESYTQTSWDQEKGRFWQAIIQTLDGRRYYADIDRRA